mmetsp:Transcript_1491/g.1912  ORF Transcript_1491/g.1912 Transcript_1491/m.1912 type:complete len:357 (+) Transcript_1491:210-1280(+)|eukprot:CAMPEP_0204824508 /NCGR_PEP_ID=MMETSP1346-20131115/2508_1 /ASSEMBLY_ACC=CAM_ASM_000771 /TAXON_ID=215587 /ORGANISM="Aplanochytrium stocchinoi, Strain GSBS06" /LENGTH=356 /DNA_ID=CAMNT_0051951681 /DNA_START=189 /DNA_END=1259 /DNA_ORIENTATION=-
MNKYLGILRWSLQYQDGTANTAKPMDPETRKWLMEAIESQIVDPVEQMENILKVLKLEPQDSNEGKFNKEAYIKNKADALDELIEYVENIDLARDFNKVGGVPVILKLLDAEQEVIRCKADEVLALVVQNHPELQEIVYKANGLDILMRHWKSENCSDKEKTKLLLAISCLIRGSADGTKSFIGTHKGVALLLQTLGYAEGDPKDSQKLRLMRKVLFLLRYLLNAVPAIRAVIATLVTSNLYPLINHEDIDCRESSLKLIELIFEDPKSLEGLEKGEWYNRFMELLKSYSADAKLPEDDPSVKLCKHILQLVEGGDVNASNEQPGNLFVKYQKGKPMKMTRMGDTVGLDLGTAGNQ